MRLSFVAYHYPCCSCKIWRRVASLNYTAKIMVGIVHSYFKVVSNLCQSTELWNPSYVVSTSNAGSVGLEMCSGNYMMLICSYCFPFLWVCCMSLEVGNVYYRHVGTGHLSYETDCCVMLLTYCSCNWLTQTEAVDTEFLRTNCVVSCCQNLLQNLLQNFNFWALPGYPCIAILFTCI